jgi:predicted nuclease with TOPRIM domain
MEADYLTEDSNLPKNQKYLTLSLLTSNVDKNNVKLKAVKIRGIYNDYNLAVEDAKKIRQVDPYFDVFVGECGKWLAVNMKQDTSTYDLLNYSVKKYMESHENNKFVHELRKNTMMINNFNDNILSREKTIEELKTLNQNNKLSDDDLMLKVEAIEKQINQLKKKQSELLEQNNLLKSKVKSETVSFSQTENKSTENNLHSNSLQSNTLQSKNDDIPTEYKYICLSFFSDDVNKAHAIKMRGAYETEALAGEQGKYLQSVDEYFNIFVGETGKWLEFNPSVESVEKSEYSNEQLNNLMKGYHENQEKAKLFHEQKKHEDMRATLLENIQEKKDKLLSNKNSSLSLSEIEEQIKLMEKEKEQLDNKINDLVSQITPSDLDLVNVQEMVPKDFSVEK